MNALAVLFRLLSLLSVAGLAAYLWILSETQKTQNNVFLDKQVRNGYSILQSAKEAQWKDISTKRSAFNEVFDDNQPVGLNDENPLADALSNLRTAEDGILRNPDYRDALDEHSKEFGAGTFIWDSEAKKWKVNPSVKADSIASLKDPFSDEKLFPKEDVQKEDGSIIPGVSRENRLRTLLGMFYKDRHEKFSEIGKMRAKIVERDEALRESQNLFDKMKEQKEEWERKSGEFEVKLGQVEADLTAEKADRKSEKEAADQQIGVLNNNIAGLEQQKLDNEKAHIAQIDAMKVEQGEKIKALGKEITLADASGYKRGIDEIAVFIITPIPGSNIYEEFDGFNSLANLTFTPTWRKDYKKLTKERFIIYSIFLCTKFLFHPLKVFKQVFNFFIKKFDTKMEMVPYKFLRITKFQNASKFKS